MLPEIFQRVFENCTPIHDHEKRNVENKERYSLAEVRFLTAEAYRFFHEFIANFITQPFFVQHDAKKQIKLEADGLGYAISEISPHKQHSK